MGGMRRGVGEVRKKRLAKGSWQRARTSNRVCPSQASLPGSSVKQGVLHSQG